MTSKTKESNLLLTGFALVFFSGFLLANSMLIGASFVPLFVYLIEVFVKSPKVQIKEILLPSSARLGEVFEVKIAGEITDGPGAVVIWSEVPKPFQLVEGSNYRIFLKKFREKSFSFNYKIRCTKCGSYTLGAGWESRHVFGLTRTEALIQETRQLKVFPKLPQIKKMRFPVHITKRVHPSEGLAKIGPYSTDFKEIRSYLQGDPFKIINWKASARAVGRGKLYPLVNEFEREGKLSIWIFLDASPDLRIGTSFENALEYGIQAVYGISHHFLSKGYKVGLYIYNHREERVHFDTGKKQFIKIGENLLKLTPSQVGLQVFWDEGFSGAVEQNRKYLITQASGIVVVTHVNSKNAGDLLNGLRKILVYKRRMRQPNILVINILPYDVVPKADKLEIFAGHMLDLASRSFSSRLRNLGLAVLDWNPAKDPVEVLLFNTALQR